MLTRRSVLPVLVLALLTRTPLRAAQQVEVIPVQGNVYMLQFSRPSEPDVFASTRGGNIGVLPGPDGVLLVDDQVPDMIEKVLGP